MLSVTAFGEWRTRRGRRDTYTTGIAPYKTEGADGGTATERRGYKGQAYKTARGQRPRLQGMRPSLGYGALSYFRVD
jgi:hypothetical protein